MAKNVTYKTSDGTQINLSTVVVDNLTTASATQALSANQGKVLKSAVDGKAASGHTHNYAGSSSAGGAATSANKLNTNAGSGTQPVYFANGVPTATTYTLGKSVPSNAVFTDTNTWRGIQNNLTSDSTSDSLSAAQGKALKTLIDGKAASNHTHNASTLINNLASGTAQPEDADYIVTQWAGTGTAEEKKQWIRRPASSFWGYIRGKTDSLYQSKGSYASSSHTHDDRYYTESEINSKLSAKAESNVLSASANLNNITTPGFYSCGGGNSITNKPSGLDAIGVIVTHNASGNYYTQILFTSSNSNMYRRTCLNGTWSSWSQIMTMSASTTDLTAGSSSLATNEIRFVYE